MCDKWLNESEDQKLVPGICGIYVLEASAFFEDVNTHGFEVICISDRPLSSFAGFMDPFSYSFVLLTL